MLAMSNETCCEICKYMIAPYGPIRNIDNSNYCENCYKDWTSSCSVCHTIYKKEKMWKCIVIHDARVVYFCEDCFKKEKLEPNNKCRLALVGLVFGLFILGLWSKKMPHV